MCAAEPRHFTKRPQIASLLWSLGPASWWVIRRELLQQVSEWWVARYGTFQILPARSWIFQILPARSGIFQMFPARSEIFQILPARSGIFQILPTRSWIFQIYIFQIFLLRDSTCFNKRHFRQSHFVSWQELIICAYKIIDNFFCWKHKKLTTETLETIRARDTYLWKGLIHFKRLNGQCSDSS